MKATTIWGLSSAVGLTFFGASCSHADDAVGSQQGADSAAEAADVPPAGSAGASDGVQAAAGLGAGEPAPVNGSSDGTPCSEQDRVGIECVDQTPPSRPVVAPEPVAASEPPSSPQAPAGACGRCSVDYCAAELASLSGTPSATAPVLECVLGKHWAEGQRASESSCGNLDLLSCYCGSAATFTCANSAPATLDGQCRDQILSGSACTDSACVQARLVEPNNAAGQALRYVRCQQDFCYDFCFNL